jgi:UDP-glucose 4-epimerase
MSNILVTGGAGFIGSHLSEELIKLGHEVTSIDNYFTGSISNHISGVRYLNCSTKQINDVFKSRKFDLVYHLGEYSRVEQSFDDIDLVWDYNKLGTYEVLKYVKNTGAKLIYAGSSTKYADQTPDYIQSPYAWSKSSNTDLVKQYAQWYGIDYAITYFYNVYSGREISSGPYATLIAKYKTLMQQNKPLPVVLPGKQKRNFTHVNDIVNALVLIGKHGQGDEYGIGSPEEFTIQEVAELFGGQIEYLDPRKGNRMSAKVITEKTIDLGWTPTHSLTKYIDTLKQNGWRE